MTTNEILISKDDLVAAYESMTKYYKEHNISRPFDKYTEMFWILFDDGANSYMWAIDRLCEYFPECNKEEVEKVLDRYL